MDKVLLVGASNELKERKMGRLIDTFDIVARINNSGNSKCMSGEYKDIIGTRTDIWFCFHTGSFVTSKQLCHKYKEIFLRPEAYDKYKNGGHTNIKPFPSDILNFTKNALNSFSKFDFTPTSGMNVLFYLIHKYENISVCGFDGFKSGHWYENMFIKDQNESDERVSNGYGGRHNGLLENEYFNYLKNTNIIKVI